jgi:transposase
MKSQNEQRNEEAQWVGMDVSKRTFDAALAGPEQRFPSTPLRALPWKAFPRTRDGVNEFLVWLDELAPKEKVRVIMEATGQYSVELTTWLTARRPSLRPAIENPKNAKAFIDSLNQRNKTDGLDARGLAFYGVERRPAPYEPLSKMRQELRELNRYRDSLVVQRTALKNRSHEKSSSKVVARMQARQLRQLDKDIATVEQEMKDGVNEDEPFKRDFELLTSIDGVGPITALTMLAEIGDLRRFERARQLTAYAGVSPRIVESGTSVRGKTRMCKRGNKRIRQALYLSAMATLNTKRPNTLSTMHYRLCDEGKEGKAALGAVMRKQLTVMRAVIISGKPYDPAFQPCGKVSARLTQ